MLSSSQSNNKRQFRVKSELNRYHRAGEKKRNQCIERQNNNFITVSVSSRARSKISLRQSGETGSIALFVNDQVESRTITWVGEVLTESLWSGSKRGLRQVTLQQKSATVHHCRRKLRPSKNPNTLICVVVWVSNSHSLFFLLL